jgi:sugar phosphate permease
MDKGKKLFYGWWVVIAITFVFFTAGAAPFAIVLKQLLEQFHTGRGEVSLSQSIMMISIGVTGIFVGRLMQRYRPRTFILWGTIVTGVTYLLLSLTNSLWFLYVFYLIIGFAAGLSNAIAYATLLSKWFARNWGTAVGIIMAGGSVGAMVIQPLVGIIDQTFGWRATYLFAGSLVLATNVPLILFVLKDGPESMGLLPDGDKPKEIGIHISDKTRTQPTGESNTAANSTGLLSYLKRPALWLMGISFTFAAIGSNAVTTQEVSFITDMKVSATAAASALGITLGIGAISGLASGWLADKLMSRYVAILFFLLAMVGTLILIQADTMSKIWLFAVIFGVGIGALGTLLPTVTRDIFGTSNFSTFFGFTAISFAVGNAIGAPLAGFMFDATGSYQIVFVIVAILFAAAIIGIYLAFGANPKPLMRLSKSKKS